MTEEQKLLADIVKRPWVFPNLQAAIKGIPLVAPLSTIFKRIKGVFTRGRSYIYRGIRNAFIVEWNRKANNIKECADIFCISKKRVQQILNSAQSLEVVRSKMDGSPPKSRLREDTNLWVKILDTNLKKKSGEASATLRSPYPRTELFSLFARGWYSVCLDQQLLAQPDLLREAQEAKKKTRFLKNILLLKKYKEAHNLEVYTCDPIMHKPIPGIKCLTYPHTHGKGPWQSED